MSDVNKEIGLYPMSGDVVRFVSTAKLPIGGFETELHPIQDLHGQDYPYPAGGGVNVADVHCEPFVSAGVTISANNNIISISGTKSGGTYKDIPFTLNAGTYYAKAFILGGTVSIAQPAFYIFDGTSNLTPTLYETERSFTIESDAQLYVRLALWGDNVTYTNYQIGIVVSKTANISTFAPYSNICPIYGKDSATIYVSPTPEITDETKVHTIEFPVQGYNQWDEEWELGTINDSTGQNAPETTIIRGKNYIPVIANTSYYFKTSNVTMRVFKYGADKSYLGYEWIQNNVLTLGEGVCFIRFRMYVAYGTTYNHDISINYPSTETGYYPYKGRTVYAGTLTINEDGSGQIVSTMASVDLGTLNWINSSQFMMFFSAGIRDLVKKPSSTAEVANILSNKFQPISYDDLNLLTKGRICISLAGSIGIVDGNTYSDVASFKTAMSGVQLVYELAEPVTIDLTVEQIETLIGYNYVWNNVGTTNITFQYYTGGEGMAITFLDCWTYPKAKLDEMFKAVDDRLDALEAAADSSNAKTTLLETKEIATGPVAEREGDE